MDEKSRMTTSVSCSPDEWRAFKGKCVMNGWTVGDRVAHLIRQDVETNDGVEVR